MKPEKPITRKEMYLDVATGGSTELPSPVTREEKYLAKIAGESVDIPTPVTRYEMLLAAVAGESYTLTPVTRLEIYLAKAAGQDVEIPQPVTREEMYWFDYCGGTPTPPEREYTGAVPVTFTADGTPLLDYIIRGNTVQNGTPTPDNPIMPQGTGERTGNLSNVSEYTNDNTDTRTYLALRILMSKNGSQTETFSSSMRGIGEKSFSFTLTTEADTMRIVHNGSQRNLFIEELTGEFSGTYTYSFDLESNDPTTIGGLELNDIMLNSGSTPLPYEPYGYKIPISSANTTTPVYLGEVESTRRIKKLVLTGTNADGEWKKSSTRIGSFYLNIETNATVSLGLCDRAVNVGTVGQYDSIGKMFVESSGILKLINLWLFDTNISLDDFKTYLAAQYAAGTPVTVWYVLAEPETGIVNEPLMRIGGYADTLSYAQAGVQIPTVNGSNTFDVETTVKPSEVYIKYKGV